MATNSEYQAKLLKELGLYILVVFSSFQKQNLHCLLVGISGKIRYNGRW